MKSPKEIIREFAQDILSLGINENELKINDSKTSFGESSYLYVGNFKVRASDHSVTSAHRIMEEMHLCTLNWNSHLNEIERHYFPERFEKLEFLSFGDRHEATDKKIQGLIDIGVEFEIIHENIKTSKKGNLISLIRVKNVESVKYIRANK